MPACDDAAAHEEYPGKRRRTVDSTTLVRASRSMRYAVAVLVAMLVYGACTRGIPREPNTLALGTMADTACWQLILRARDSAAYRPQARNCTDAEDLRRRIRAIDELRPQILQTGVSFLDVPEAHDEQRLSIGGDSVGPMAYLFALPTLGGFIDTIQFGNHGSRGALVGMVYVLRLPTSPPTLPQSYQRLSLAYGPNCVYLALRPGGGRWGAYVTQPDQDTRICKPETNPAWLPVHRTTVPVAGIPGLYPVHDYPPVARFSETRDGRPLLGFRCADGWCDIGPDAALVRAAMAGGPPGRESILKGWHDEQVLTVRSGQGDFTGVLRAKITPMRNLERVNLEVLRSWTSMATITVASVPTTGKYSTWGMRPGDNVLQLRIDPVTGAGSARMISPAMAAAAPDTTELLFVGRHEHFDVGIPGTARFRWTLADDGVWVPCDQGCCKVEGQTALSN